MQIQPIYKEEEVWVKILSKGLITIPKAIREEIGMNEGEVAKITKVGRMLIIKPRDEVVNRLFTNQEIAQWQKKDQLPKNLAQEAANIWSDLI